jgi:ribonuclease HI
MSATELRRIVVFTDGAAKGNPGPAGWAWWVTPDVWQAGGWPHATNNLAELTAVEQALTALTDTYQHHPLTIVSDSKYVIDSCSKWIHAYRRNGWRTSKGSAVANADTIRSIDALISGRGSEVTWRWQRGHVGAYGNTQADFYASAAADAFKAGRDPLGGPSVSQLPQ